MRAEDEYSGKKANSTYFCFAIAIFVFMLVDLGINSSIDFDDYSGSGVCKDPACLAMRIILLAYYLFVLTVFLDFNVFVLCYALLASFLLCVRLICIKLV